MVRRPQPKPGLEPLQGPRVERDGVRPIEEEEAADFMEEGPGHRKPPPRMRPRRWARQRHPGLKEEALHGDGKHRSEEHRAGETDFMAAQTSPALQRRPRSGRARAPPRGWRCRFR